MKINQALAIEYAPPKPVFPIGGWLLTILGGVAIVSLWLAAYQAFLNIASSPLHAAGLATLIEGGAFVTAFVWTKEKGWWESLGLVVMGLVSGIYQLTQATQAAGGKLNDVELYALAWGPLVATVLVAIILGNIYNEYQSAVAAWQDEKSKWIADKQAEAEAETKRLAANKLARQRQLEDNAIASAEKEKTKREKAEARARKQAQPPQLLPEPAGSEAEASGALPEWAKKKPKDIGDYRKLIKSGDINPPTDFTAVTLRDAFGIGGRTARNWRSDGAANELINGNLAENGHKKAVQNGK